MEQIKKNKIHSFRDIKVWQEAHILAVMTYDVTKKYPHTEQFGLVSQMRRAGVSISSNIAEGFGRLSIREKIQFYNIARASLSELENQFILSRDVKLINQGEFEKIDKQMITVHRLINAFISGARKLSVKTA